MVRSRLPRGEFFSVDAAAHLQRRLVGVVLTGYLDDGTAGLNAVKTHGGVAIVQDPEEALAPSMPQSALRNVKVDHCLPLAEIGPLLNQLASGRNVPSQKKRSAYAETADASERNGD